jgi:hypothetical protein
MEPGSCARLLAVILGLAGCMVDRRVAVIQNRQADGQSDGQGGSQDDGGGDSPTVTNDASDDAAGPRFAKIPPGQPLPSDATCTARVRRSSWEPRPDNGAHNRQVPTAAQLAQLPPWDSNVGFDNRAVAFGRRVNGDFVGTTDEILQWGACKWGFDEDFVRASAQQASDWRQTKISTWTTNTAVCPSGAATRAAAGGTECAQVYGIFQLMWQFSKSAWPMSRDSTPFNVDYALGTRRACFEGMLPWLNSAPAGQPYLAGDEFGCLGADYSGAWYDRAGSDYITAVRTKLDAKSWTQPGF